MIEMCLGEIARVVGGTLTGPRGEVRVTGPAFLDSRSPEPGGLFVAIAGEHADGHAYAEAALARGAAAVLGSRDTGAPGIVVADPVGALGVLARHVLDRLSGVRVLALTGSQGKTGTKDYLAQVLARRAATVATAGNYNNELGVPLTVLRADESTRFLVVEMGARGLGHIGYLCRVSPPQIAAVLNVGTAHVGEFGSREAIAQAKGEIIEALPAGGVAVLNADDPLVAAMADRVPPAATTATFGRDGDVAWRSPVLDELGRASFELTHAGRACPVRLRQPGEHQVANAAAAAAMALAAGLSLEQIAEGLSEARPISRWRMEVTDRADGLTVLNDAYNANPASMAAAVATLGAIGARSGRRTVAVLGEMYELGETADDGHREVGAAVAEQAIDVLVTVGAGAEPIAAGARSAAGRGGWRGMCVVTAGRDEALDWLRENVRAPDVVLVKASRGLALEHVASGLLEGTTTRNEADAGAGDV